MDESCHPSLARGLRLIGIDVTTTQEAGLLGVPDHEQLAHAHSDGRAIITFDADFTKLHHAGLPHSGIVYCHQQKHTVGAVIQELALIWEVYDADEFTRRLEYI